MRAAGKGAAILALGLCGAVAEASEDEQRAGRRVTQLRVQVDELAHRLQAERRRAQDALAALRAERADLERQLRLEGVRRAALDRLESERTAKRESMEAESANMVLPIRRAVESVRRYVQVALPFQPEARLRKLHEIEARLASLSPDPAQALSRLWRFVEEEENMTREIGLSQQPISLEGERQLVDVARIGMAALYFRTLDGQLGWARQMKGGAWKLELAQGPSAKRALREVISAFEDNRTWGRHVLVVPSRHLEGQP